MLKGIDESIERTTLENVDYRIGKMVKVQDSSTKVDRVFCLIGDSHKWSNSQFEMNIVLDIVKI